MALFDIFTGKKKKETVKVTRMIPKRTTLTKSGLPAASINFAQSRGIFASANQDIFRNLEKTRDLSRYLCGIDPFLQRYIEVVSVFVIGQDGLRLEPTITSNDGILNQEVNTAIKTAWDAWSVEATYDGTLSFNEVEQLVVRTLARDGEAIVRFVTGPSVNKYGFAVQVLDPALLDTNYNTVTKDDHTIIMGVEFDLRGRPVAYHVWNRLISDITAVPRIRERIPSDEFIHLFDSDTPGTARALPWTTSVLNTVSRLNQYLEVHLQACSIAATTPLVMTNTEAETLGVDDVAVGTQGTETYTQQVIDLAYSQIIELDHGKSLSALQVPFPTQAFEQTTKAYLQSIAAGLFVSYATLTADPASGNSANIRFSSIVEREHFQQMQRWLIKNLHMKVYKKWIESATLYGALRLPTMTPEEYWAVNFRTTRSPSIDPAKDLKAYITGLEQGLYTRSQIANELGTDFLENVKELAKEQQILKDYGVVLGEQKPQEQQIVQQ